MKIQVYSRSKESDILLKIYIFFSLSLIIYQKSLDKVQNMIPTSSFDLYTCTCTCTFTCICIHINIKFLSNFKLFIHHDGSFICISVMTLTTISKRKRKWADQEVSRHGQSVPGDGGTATTTRARSRCWVRGSLWLIYLFLCELMTFNEIRIPTCFLSYMQKIFFIYPSCFPIQWSYDWQTFFYH